jgi:hypothetical protein
MLHTLLNFICSLLSEGQPVNTWERLNKAVPVRLPRNIGQKTNFHYFQLYINNTQNAAISLFFISAFSTLVNPERLGALKS